MLAFCLSAMVNGFELSAGARQELDEAGFTIVPGPVPAGDLARLTDAYDAVVDSAAPDNVSVGSSTTRVNDFVNRGPAGSMIIFNESSGMDHSESL